MHSVQELNNMVDVSISVESNVVDFHQLSAFLHIIVNRLCPCTVDANCRNSGNIKSKYKCIQNISLNYHICNILLIQIKNSVK